MISIIKLQGSSTSVMKFKYIFCNYTKKIG